MHWKRKEIHIKLLVVHIQCQLTVKCFRYMYDLCKSFYIATLAQVGEGGRMSVPMIVPKSFQRHNMRASLAVRYSLLKINGLWPRET